MKSLTNRTMENQFKDKAYYEALLTKYLHHECSESELRVVAEFLTGDEHRDLLPELFHRASLKFHSGFKMKNEHSAELWAKVSGEVHTMDRRGRKRKLMLWATRIAACLVLILGLAYLVHLHFFIPPQTNYLTKTTERGQRLTFQLSDGSKVKLNAESTLTYPEKFDGNTREIQLSGEAFFEVTKDPNRPFIVGTGEVNTEVLGTSFNISAFPGRNIVVTVATGKVNVSAVRGTLPSGEITDNQSFKNIILTPGQQAVYDVTNKGLTHRKVNPGDHLGWKEGILKFNETPLGEVVEILQRWYDVDIQFVNKQLASCAVTSTFQSERIKDVLEELKFIFKLDYTINDRTIVVSGEGCR